MAASPYAKGLGLIEMALAALLTVSGVRALSSMLFPDDVPGEEWAPLVLMVAAPLAASLWLTGIALFRNWRSRWLLHLIPPAFLLGVWLFFWWLDRGVRN